jgi:hypothetical protein
VQRFVCLSIIAIAAFKLGPKEKQFKKKEILLGHPPPGACRYGPAQDACHSLNETGGISPSERANPNRLAKRYEVFPVMMRI